MGRRPDEYAQDPLKQTQFKGHVNVRLDETLATDIKDACMVAGIPSISAFFRAAAQHYLAATTPSIMLRRLRPAIISLLNSSYPGGQLYFTGDVAIGQEKIGSVVDCLVTGNINIDALKSDLAQIIPGATFNITLTNEEGVKKAFNIYAAPFAQIIDN